MYNGRMSALWNHCAFYYIAGFGITLSILWNRLCMLLNYIDKKPTPNRLKIRLKTPSGGIMGHGRLIGQSTKGHGRLSCRSN